MNHGKVRAMEQPEPITIDEFSVWTAENIVSVTVADEDGGSHTEYEFDLTQYGKDEYIHGMIDQNASLEGQLTDAQLALCELYEMIASTETAELLEGDE